MQPVLAVLNFENKSGDPALDYWRDSLAELLAADLSQSRYIRVVTTDQMLTALRRLGLADAPAYSSDDIARIALHTRAGKVLRGSFFKAGQTIVLVTHDARAAAYADRVFVIGDGRIRDEIELGRRADHSAAPLIARLAQVGL